MSEFCFYRARGEKLEPKVGMDGKEHLVVVDHWNREGMVKNDQYLYGSIMRQNPVFLGCNRLTVHTYQL